MARTKDHFIWTGDYADRINRLAAAVKAAQADVDDLKARLKDEAESEEPRLLSDVSTTRADLDEAQAALDALAADYQALKAEAEESGLRVTLRGLSDDEWYDITDNHPPREDERFKENDAALGFNERTGTRDLVMAALADPEFGSRAKFDAWVAEKGLSRGDLAVMMGIAHELTNGMGYTDPKLLRLLPTRSADAG